MEDIADADAAIRRLEATKERGLRIQPIVTRSSAESDGVVERERVLLCQTHGLGEDSQPGWTVYARMPGVRGS